MTQPMNPEKQAELVSITVDRVFGILDAALADAIEKSSRPGQAKAVAWDVRGHFLTEIGQYCSLRSLASRGGE